MQHKVLTVKQILSNFPNMDKIEKGPKEIFSPDIQKDLLLLEEQEGSVNFKFGVIYMKQGQTTDDEILSNGKPNLFSFYFVLSSTSCRVWQQKLRPIPHALGRQDQIEGLGQI